MDKERLELDSAFKEGYLECIKDIKETVSVRGDNEWIDISKQFPSSEFDWLLVCEEPGSKIKMAHFVCYDKDEGAHWYADDGTFIPLDSWFNVAYWRPIDICTDDATIISALIEIEKILLNV